MPQLSFPKVFKGDEEVLEVCGSFISLLCKKVGNRVDIHDMLWREDSILRESVQV